MNSVDKNLLEWLNGVKSGKLNSRAVKDLFKWLYGVKSGKVLRLAKAVIRAEKAAEAEAKKKALDSLPEAEKKVMIAERNKQEAEAKAARENHEKNFISYREACTYCGGAKAWKAVAKKVSHVSRVDKVKEVSRADFEREHHKVQTDAREAWLEGRLVYIKTKADAAREAWLAEHNAAREAWLAEHNAARVNAEAAALRKGNQALSMDFKGLLRGMRLETQMPKK